jgi:hypothetical protein
MPSCYHKSYPSDKAYHFIIDYYGKPTDITVLKRGQEYDIYQTNPVSQTGIKKGVNGRWYPVRGRLESNAVVAAIGDKIDEANNL